MKEHGPHKVHLGNLPPEITAKDLAEAFGEVSACPIESVDVMHDKDGFASAVVVFTSGSDAENAIRRYNGGDLNGRRLEVQWSDGRLGAIASLRDENID